MKIANVSRKIGYLVLIIGLVLLVAGMFRVIPDSWTSYSMWCAVIGVIIISYKPKDDNETHN